MEDLKSVTRNEELDDSMKIVKISADAQTLWDILIHSSEGIHTEGWGKLLGYFEEETKNLFIKESYPLVLNDGEKIKRDAPIENYLKKMNAENRFVYRQVGFYIISSDYEYFTSKVMNYLINNDNIKAPNVFLYFDINKAKINKNPWNFYEPSEEFNKICNVHRFEEKCIYEVDKVKLDEFIANKSDFLRRIDYDVKRTPVFDLMVLKNNSLFEKIYDNDSKLDNELYINQMISGINELVINKNAELNAKKQDVSNKMNLYGTLTRNKNLISKKREILDELKQVIEKYSEKCTN